MPFGNPAVGGIELVRNAISSPNYAAGTTGWIINRDGSAEFNNMGSFDVVSAPSILYGGVELSTYLNKYASGVVGLMWLNTGGTTRQVVLPGERLMLQTQFTWHSSKRYFVYVGALRTQNTATNNFWYILRARPASLGNVQLTDGPAIWLDEKHTVVANTWDGFGPCFEEVTGYINGIVADGQQMNIAWSINGGGGTESFFPGDDWIFAVIDMGYDAPNTGVDLYTASVPAKTYRTFQVNANDSQSFQGSGPASNGSGSSNADVMYYGTDPGYAPNGNWKSLAWFDKASTAGGNGQGSLNNMSGALAADVDYLDIWVYTAWWYQIAGGTLQLGMTGAAPNHSSYPGGTASIVTAGYTARGQGQWISVKGTSIQTAVLNGTFTGIQLGPGPTSALAYYGYALGAGHAGANGPAIRGGYYK